MKNMLILLLKTLSFIMSFDEEGCWGIDAGSCLSNPGSLGDSVSQSLVLLTWCKLVVLVLLIQDSMW